MSEYQYYYFEAIDKPLTDQQQKELRKISTRAQINSRRFENEYNFGNLKADPLNLVKKYFDIHLYYANWGTRIIMFKVPRERIDFDLVKRYENCETFDICEIGRDLILQLTADRDDNDEWWEESLDIQKYTSLRDDLMEGDYRCLYIAWLAHLREVDENDGCDPPPRPVGMKNLTGTLRAFVDFMYLDEDTLTTALESASDNEPSLPTPKEIKDWVACLPDKDRQQIIVDLLQEKTTAQIIQRELRNRFLKERNPETSITKKSETPCPRKPRKKP